MKFDKADLPPPSLQARQERVEQVRAIRSYAHLIIVRWSKTQKEIGAAVLMRAGKHLLAITAEHCVHDDMRLAFPVAEGQKSRAQILKAIRKKPLDIAVLELEDRPDALACNIEQVCLDLPTPASKDTDPAAVPVFFVVGYPADAAQMTESTLAVAEEVFGTNIVEVNPNDFSLYYHEDAYGIWEDLTYGVALLPKTPKGFSGGGVWGFSKPGPGELFDPLKHVRLYGIQYAWLDQTRRLKCIPSRVIVEMLFENYPDLRESLTRLFPSLASATGNSVAASPVA